MQKPWRDLDFSLSRSIPTEKSQKIFFLLQKIFSERKLLCMRLDFDRMLLWNKTRNPEQAESLHLVLG